VNVVNVVMSVQGDACPPSVGPDGVPGIPDYSAVNGEKGMRGERGPQGKPGDDDITQQELDDYKSQEVAAIIIPIPTRLSLLNCYLIFCIL